MISRSGDECVVALTDQWYLTYGEEEWQRITIEALEKLETYSDEAKNSFRHCLGKWETTWWLLPAQAGHILCSSALTIACTFTKHVGELPGSS